METQTAKSINEINGPTERAVRSTAEQRFVETVDVGRLRHFSLSR